MTHDRWDPYATDYPLGPEQTAAEVEAERLYWEQTKARQAEERRKWHEQYVWRNCPDCGGTGRVTIRVEHATARNAHDYVVSDPCPKCDGTGHVEEEGTDD